MTKPDERGDTKILAIVVGGLVLAAVGLALLAGLATEKSDELERVTQRPRPTAPRPADPAPVLPAARTIGTSAQPEVAVERLPGSMVTAEIETVVAFEIDPAADFRAAAHEGWNERDYAKAAAYFAAEADARPDHAYTHYMLGLSRWKDGDADGAADAMRRSAELNDASIKTFINLSRIENDRGEFAAALAAAERAAGLDENDATALFVRARSLYNAGRVDEAVVVLEASLAVDADNGYARNLHGLILLGQARAGDAVMALEQAVQLEPGVAFIHNNLGAARETEGDLPGAFAAYRAATEIDPAHERATVSVARLEPLVPAIQPVEADAAAALASTEEEEEASEDVSEPGL